ncbi:MAG: acyltransferase [Chloroflexi bacterium]|nr:acyltransferase [Chloroflexota bacterium]
MTRSKAPFFPGIQYLRGFAALYVVTYHVNSDFHFPILANGYLGVQLFFMVSGFLMTYIHGQDRGLAAAGNFVRKRLIRIYPAYMIAFVPVVLIFHFMPSKGFAWHRDPVNIVRNFFLLHNPAQSILGVSWTLVYELMFYAIFCTWIIVLRRHMVGLLSGWFVLILANTYFFQIATGRLLFLDQINLYFIAGCFIALFYQRIPYKTNGAFLLFSLVIFILCPFFSTATISIFATCFILCLVCVLYEPARQFQFLIELGNASYSIYLTHLTIVAIVTSFIKQPWIMAPLFLICIVAGLLFYRYIERPTLQRLHKYSLPVPTTAQVKQI